MVQVNARFFPVGSLSQGRAMKGSITNTTMPFITKAQIKFTSCAFSTTLRYLGVVGPFSKYGVDFPMDVRHLFPLNF